ncbi:MAG: hypothetical protein EZS28_035639, partial [Streblomastix strix]
PNEDDKKEEQPQLDDNVEVKVEIKEEEKKDEI